MVHKISLTQACDGLIRYKTATGKSPHTIADYRNSFKKLLLFFEEDPPFGSVTRELLIEFFSWLQEEYLSEPNGVAPRGKRPLSAKSVRNIHTNLSALWTWAVDEEFSEENPLRSIEKPQANPPVIEPFTKEEIAASLKACDQSRTWKSRHDLANSRPTADRDRAIILTLLDTGIRASELCGILFRDLNLDANRVTVRGKGPGRQPKERVVYFGKRTGQAIWKNLLPRLEEIQDGDPVFVAGHQQGWRPMSRHVLWRLLKRIGERAGVDKVHPHRFRHTFAITYIRNGGDIFTLKALLGHSDLAMVERYARIAQTDSATAHRRASPVDNWRL